jgi:hypothetical protein
MICPINIKDAQTVRDHYLWFTHLIQGISASRCFRHLHLKDMHRIDLSLKAAANFKVCRMETKLCSSMLQQTIGPGYPTMIRLNLRPTFEITYLQHLPK